MKKSLIAALATSFIIAGSSQSFAQEVKVDETELKIEESGQEVLDDRQNSSFENSNDFIATSEDDEIIEESPSNKVKDNLTSNEDLENLDYKENQVKKDVVINEVETDDDIESDYVELFNKSNEKKDISNWYILDDDKTREIERIEEGTFISPKDFHILEEGRDFSFGLGKNDEVSLYDKDGNLVDHFSWDGHAFGSYGRYPDGSENFVDGNPSKGEANNEEENNEIIVNENSALKINEIESSDPNDGPDYAEIYNESDKELDISGYFILDDNLTRNPEVLPDGTIIRPRGYFVFEKGSHFSFGLGKNDQVNLFNKAGELIDTFSWDRHADGVYARDKNGSFIDTDPSKGFSNLANKDKIAQKNPIVINEVESSAEAGGKDYAEIFNRSNERVDISGWFILDDNKDHEKTPIKENTFINPKGYFVFEEGVDFDFGLGSNDEVRLYDKDGNLIDKFSWTSHARGTYGRLEDGFGEFTDTNPTKGRKNQAFTPEIIDIPTANFPGKSEVKILDEKPVFNLNDLSGLDHDGRFIYGVNNKEGRFVIFSLEDEKIKLAPGFSNEGKSVAFIEDKDNPNAAGPDSEGITVDKDGYIYLAVERDNSDKNVNKNMILQIKDPFKDTDKMIADKQWDITNILPDVGANLGIETIEWVSFENLQNRLYDQKLDKPFDLNDYKGAFQDGVFFVGLEANGNIYGLILNQDGSGQVISEISTNLGGVMGMDYDIENDLLVTLSDDGYDNTHTVIQFNGTKTPNIINVSAPDQMNKRLNNEGFVILPSDESNTRDVLYFMDGTNKEAIRLAKLDKDYMEKLGLSPIKVKENSSKDPAKPEENLSQNSINKEENKNSLQGSIKSKENFKKRPDKEKSSKNENSKREKSKGTDRKKEIQGKNKDIKIKDYYKKSNPKTGISSLNSILMTSLGSLTLFGLFKKRK